MVGSAVRGGETRLMGHVDHTSDLGAVRGEVGGFPGSRVVVEMCESNTRVGNSTKVPRRRPPSFSPSSFARHTLPTHPRARAEPRAPGGRRYTRSRHPSSPRCRNRHSDTHERLEGSFLDASAQTKAPRPTPWSGDHEYHIGSPHLGTHIRRCSHHRTDPSKACKTGGYL